MPLVRDGVGECAFITIDASDYYLRQFIESVIDNAISIVPRKARIGAIQYIFIGTIVMI